MEKDKAQSDDPSDHHGGLDTMENVTKCTQELVAAICNSRAYANYEEAKRKMRENDELREKLNQFRRTNYEFQNRKDSVDWYEDVANFERENEEFRKDPLVEEYLQSELELCRMLPRINQSLVRAVHLEIEEFADAIEW